MTQPTPVPLKVISADDSLDLDIGVIYTHEQHYMDPLIESLADSGHDLRMRLLLVDNASTEGVSRWCGQFAETAIIRNQRRLGYAENLNLILSASTARHTLLLNTDMVFDPLEQTLTKMVQFMDARSGCGIAGCRLYHPEGEYAYPARRFPSLRAILARRGGALFRSEATTREHLYADLDPLSSFPCDWLSGCFLLVRRECHEQIGGLDARRFRKYFEDVDYCQRAGEAGWEVCFCGDTYGYHWEQRASRELFSRDSRLHLQSYARWLLKRLARHCGLRSGSVVPLPPAPEVEVIYASDQRNKVA